MPVWRGSSVTVTVIGGISGELGFTVTLAGATLDVVALVVGAGTVDGTGAVGDAGDGVVGAAPDTAASAFGAADVPGFTGVRGNSWTVYSSFLYP